MAAAKVGAVPVATECRRIRKEVALLDCKTKGKELIARIAIPASLTFGLLGCLPQDRVEVEVRPTGYKVGSVVSKSATDAVNEVVRRQHEAVLIRTCTEAPSALVNQFQIELQARMNVELKVSITEECRQ